MKLIDYATDKYYEIKTRLSGSPYDLVNPNKLGSRDKALINRLVQQFTDRTRKDIKKWRTAISAAENPEGPRRYLLHDIYTEALVDNHLFSQVQLRKLATMAKEFKVVNVKTGEKDEDKTRLLEKPWFFAFMDIALDVEYHGTTLIEVDNIVEGELTGVHMVPRKHVVPETKEVLKDIADEKGIPYNTPEFEPWIVEIKEDIPLGILMKVIPQVIWKRNAQQSWAEFIERFGLPYRTATTNKSSKKDLDRIETMLQSMGSAAYGIFPEGTQLDFKESANRDAYQVFDKKIERANSEISKAINSVTMLSDDGSSRSQSQVHQEVNDKLVISDGRKIKFLINEKLFPLLTKHGYGLEGFEFDWDVTEKLSKKELWEVVQGIAGIYNVPEDYITQTFGVPTKGVKQVAPTQNAAANFNGGHAAPAAHGLSFAWPDYSVHQGCAALISEVENKANTKKYESLFSGMADDLFNKKGSELPAPVHLERLKHLENGFKEGFKSRIKIDYDSPDSYRVAMHQANLGRFTAAATWKDVINMNEAARNAKNFSEFKKSVADYQKTNLTYLQTEYEHTISASQNGANWLRAVEDKDTVDLRYETAGDNRVREEHQDLNGIVAPVDDAIWNSIYPPNGWRCRCEAVEIPKGSKKASDTSKANTSVVSKGFRHNPGKTNHIFDNAHAYFKEFPDEKTLSRKKYGLEDWTKIVQTKKASSGIAQGNQASYEKWWAGETKRLNQDNKNIYYKNYFGLFFKLPEEKLLNKFAASRYAKENRWGIAPVVESILNNPDEVWIQKGKSGIRYASNYLKAYKDGIYAVVVNSEAEGQLEVIDWFKVGETKIAVDTASSGILIKKSI